MHIIQSSQAFIPTTAREVQSLGWQQMDVILVTGDTYTETDPFSGQKIFVEKNAVRKQKQKAVILRKNKVSRPRIDSDDVFHRTHRVL